MNILYTCDNNYVWLMAVSVISLFENNKNLNDLNIYLLGEKISSDNKQKLLDISNKYKRNIFIIDVTNIEVPTKLVSSRWPLSAFTRLFAYKLLPKDIEKIIYLDCDTIVNGDIALLDNVDFQDNLIIGVKDCINKRYKRNIGLNYNDTYINAGVILMNIEKIRKIDIKKKIDIFIDNYGSKISFADQDILNGIFQNNIGFLNPEYNVMTLIGKYNYNKIIQLRRPTAYYDKKTIENARKKPIIIHYTTNMKIIRPWFYNSNHIFKDVFLQYLSKSPWRNINLCEFIFNTKESKLIDILQIFPEFIRLRLLGFFHAFVKPNYIFIKSKFYKNL